MPSKFAALEDRMSAACDHAFADDWTWLPYVAEPGGGRRKADPDRDEQTGIPGIFEAEAFVSTEFGSEARGSLPATMTSPTLSIDVENLPNGQPRRLDRMRQEDTGDVYEISQAELDYEGRLNLKLKIIARG